MCGIAGLHFKKEVNPVVLEKFRNLVNTNQYKRGPDEFNMYEVEPNLFFFHNMLSIIDMGNAKQPMHDDNGAITYNGEIYNYKDLKYSDEVYNLHSDTEVLLKGLHRDYLGFLPRTNSMFGFGYYSKGKQLLTLCRDRIGIKPVYYIDNDEVFAFASTLTPLVIFSQKRLNHDKLWQYYLNRAFKAPYTIFEDIFEIPPASYLEFDMRGSHIIKTGQWWERKPVEDIYKDENEVIDSIEQLLIDSIKNRLVADVPVGLFLSGGVDSSLIAALTSRQKSDLNAFTVAFHDKQFDESGYARRVCERYGIQYNEIRVDANDFLYSIEDWIKIQDDIVADPSALLLYKISDYASSLNYRALLAGEGSDELFGGYNAYKYFNWSKRIYNSGGKYLPFADTFIKAFKNNSKTQNFVTNSLKSPYFYGTATIFEPHLLSQLLPGCDGYDSLKVTDVKQAMDLDIKDRLPNDLLTRSDRSTMGTSVELRVPFLAHQLVDYSAGIPAKLLMKNGVPKYLMKKLASKYLDQDQIYRRKVGFDLPIHKWISNEMRDLVSESIQNSVQKEYIDISVIEKCFDLHVNQNVNYSTKIWAFLCLELSYRYLSKI